MEIERSSTPAMTAGIELGYMLERYQKQPTLLLLSGGSALSMLDYVAESAPGPQLTISTLDERFSVDPQINNFSQIKATNFYQQVRTRGACEIDTSITPADTLQVASRRFEAGLRAWRTKYNDGVVIATLGVGMDGHTAGIFPGEYGVNFSGDAWVVGYELPAAVNPFTKRFTVTYTFLRTQITEALIYVVGEQKKDITLMIERSDIDPRLPVAIIQELSRVKVVSELL